MRHMYPGARKTLTDSFLDDLLIIGAHEARAIEIYHIHRCLTQPRQQLPANDLTDPGDIQKIRTDTLRVYLFCLAVIEQTPLALGGAAVRDQYIHPSYLCLQVKYDCLICSPRYAPGPCFSEKKYHVPGANSDWPSAKTPSGRFIKIIRWNEKTPSLVTLVICHCDDGRDANRFPPAGKHPSHRLLPDPETNPGRRGHGPDQHEIRGLRLYR